LALMRRLHGFRLRTYFTSSIATTDTCCCVPSLMSFALGFSELKHSRCAMVATTGFLIQAAGIHFPGMLSSDVSFASLSGMNPVDQWAAVPDAGTIRAGSWRLQFVCACAKVLFTLTVLQARHKSSELSLWQKLPLKQRSRIT
jgi:Chlorophyll A-B binding protein